VYQLLRTGITTYSSGNSSNIVHMGCSFDFNTLTNNCTVKESV